MHRHALSSVRERARSAVSRLLAHRRSQEAPRRARLEALSPLDPFPLRAETPRAGPGPVTHGFVEQLDGWEPDLDALGPWERHAWEQANDEDRQFLRVMFAVWYDAPGFRERSGLRVDDPPEDVHAMARGPFSAGGALDAADLIVRALQAAGVQLGDARRALDFGGSSGRVVRVLQAAYPQVEWHSCDPNEGAIRWAQEHLPAVQFHHTAVEPPTPFDESGFDLVSAFGIWTQFSEAAALRWLDEIRRITRPGGIFVLTLQSWNATHHYARNGLWDERDVYQVVADLVRSGHHFRQIFGPEGDHGVVSPDWGMAFLSQEWLLRQVTPAWTVLHYGVAVQDGNHDVAVLQLRDGS
jgi:SAM-dependent methyltransferase